MEYMFKPCMLGQWPASSILYSKKTDLLAHVTLKGSKVFLKFHKFPVFPALILVNFHNSVLIFFTSVRPPLYVCVA